MALTRPTLLNTAPFDANAAHVFNYTTSGSSSVIAGNTLRIQRNDNLAVVYEQRQGTYAYSHNLPAGTLSNGVTYLASIQTYSADGSQSLFSNPIIFRCLQTPTFAFTNMPSGNVIANNSYQFELLYNQANGELLNSVIFNLYSSSGALLSTSGPINDFSSIPAVARYLFSGFKNHTAYSIEAVGQTVNGMALSTGEIDIVVEYGTRPFFSKLKLTNNCKEGYISINTAVVAIDGVANPANPTYIDNDIIWLKNDGDYVEFNDGYMLNSHFIVKLWAYQFNPNTQIFSMSTINGDSIYLYYIVRDNTVYIRLLVVDEKLIYVAESNKIDAPQDNEKVFVMLKKVNNFYQINIVNKGA